MGLLDLNEKSRALATYCSNLGQPRRALMNIQSLQLGDLLYPAALTVGNKPPAALQTIGNQQLLATSKTAVLCSRTCPGEVILRVYDLARRLRNSDLTFIGGFHTPVERDFLHHLLAGSCKLILCPARTLEGMRLPTDWRKAMDAGRLLLLSAFTADSQRRQSARLAERRNELVMALADQVLLLHVAPGSHTERLGQQASQREKLVLTSEADTNAIFEKLNGSPPDVAVKLSN